MLNSFVVIIKLTQCMEIYDELDVANYCTDQQGLCADAENSTHIVCEYYGKIGSACSKFEEIPLDESNAKNIIMQINSMRSNIATGIVIGKDQRKLPQGYGLMRVSWDSELASFAKLMMKQCLTTHKYSCAATDYFGNPIMTYMYANTSSSAVEIINSIFSSWNATALQISLEDIQHCPDLKVGEKSHYLKLVVGNVTNVGCALGIYKHDTRVDTKPFGHIICYLSHYAKPSTQVYNTTPPVPGLGWSKCGCPPTLRETANCLCVGFPKLRRPRHYNLTSIVTTPLEPQPTRGQPQVTITEQLKSTLKYDLESRSPGNLKLTQQVVKVIPQQQPTTQSNKDETSVSSNGTPAPSCHVEGDCEPKIIMMPIFTIQNAHMGQSHRRFGNITPLRTVKAKDGYSYSDEQYHEMPKNISLRSKLLWTLREIRKNPNIHFFSYEENVEQNERIKAHGHRNVTPENSHEDREEKTMKVMKLLDLLERKGKTAQFNSREIIEFDAKMRRIYKSVIATREESGDMQF